MTLFIHASLIAVAVTGITLLSSAHAQADGIDCDITEQDVAGAGNDSTGNPTVCATAADFGWQAGQIRGALQSRHAFRLSGHASGSTVRLSTSGNTSRYSGITSLSTQRTNGDFEGDATGLLLGIDRPFQSGAFVLGAMAQVSRSNVTAPASPKVEREELLFGPYFTSSLSETLFLDGYLLYGTPDYTVGGSGSDGEAWTGGLTLTMGIPGDRMNLFPFVAIAFKSEEPDSSTEIDSTILTLGTDVHFAQRSFTGGQSNVFAKFEVDFGQYEDNLGTEIDYVAPRLGLGTDIVFDRGGALRLGINGSRASDSTNMMSAQAMYRISF